MKDFCIDGVKSIRVLYVRLFFRQSGCDIKEEDAHVTEASQGVEPG